MSKFNLSCRCIALAVIVCSLSDVSAVANPAFPVIGDINGFGEDPVEFDGTNVFLDSGSFVLDEEGVFQGNEILVTTYNGVSDFAGWGISVAISNGENGSDSSEGGLNIDEPNLAPVNSAIVAANTGPGTNNSGKLSNGNVVRASMWMRSDPNSPVVSGGPDPQVEGILKIELWKEGLSSNGDFDPNDGADPSFGDRIWDQDQQGGDGAFADINGDGDAGQFFPSADITLSTTEWRQLVVEYVVDDNPADPGNTSFPWTIAGEQFTVADVEDVRAVFFAGDFTGSSNFTNGGSYWSDNLLLEVFADQAAADLVDPAVSNPAPVESAADFDGDGDVDGADFLGIQQFDSGSIADWQAAYPVVPSSISAVPEPGSALLALLGAVLFASRRI